MDTNPLAALKPPRAFAAAAGHRAFLKAAAAQIISVGSAGRYAELACAASAENRPDAGGGARGTLLAGCLIAVIGSGSPGPALSAELWGAYAGYDFDHIQGDEGYGVAWNHPDAATALARALEICRRHQPPPPQGEAFDEAWRYHSGRRCGDVVFAFSSDGPDPETVTREADPSWERDFEKLTVLQRHRCIGVVELSNDWEGFEVLGSNFHMEAANSEEALAALTESEYARMDCGPSECVPNPYRVAVVACNDH